MDNQAFLAEMADMLEVDPSEFDESFHLDSGNFDSVAAVGTIALIDEHFGVRIDAKRIGNCKSVGELMRLIESKA